MLGPSVANCPSVSQTAATMNSTSKSRETLAFFFSSLSANLVASQIEGKVARTPLLCKVQHSGLTGFSWTMWALCFLGLLPPLCPQGLAATSMGHCCYFHNLRESDSLQDNWCQFLLLTLQLLQSFVPNLFWFGMRGLLCLKLLCLSCLINWGAKCATSFCGESNCYQLISVNGFETHSCTFNCRNVLAAADLCVNIIVVACFAIAYLDEQH